MNRRPTREWFWWRTSGASVENMSGLLRLLTASADNPQSRRPWLHFGSKAANEERHEERVTITFT
jgi:hypothetical protein